LARAERPFSRPGGDLNQLRERLLDVMWDNVGVIRDAASLQRGMSTLDELERELLASGPADGERPFNLGWHDWLNLRSLLEVSKAIAAAALERKNSRGAHFREDFSQEGDLAASTFTVVRQHGDRLMIGAEPVKFTIVRPGESLLQQAAARA
jgi:fumarate reductase flavoprotein subunit